MHPPGGYHFTAGHNKSARHGAARVSTHLNDFTISVLAPGYTKNMRPSAAFAARVRNTTTAECAGDTAAGAAPGTDWPGGTTDGGVTACGSAFGRPQQG
jgi:hypothetical protein